MPRPPTTSPVTGKTVPITYIHSSSAHFQDTSGRSILLRGVNLSGGAKAPHNQPSHQLEGFWEEAEAGRGDFVGRPLNLEDGSADVHLARLRAWGFNMLRYVFTWEAIEHQGPGKYDEEYIDYVVKVLQKCKEWGFRVFMDPHQDVWSRFSGGSGAPLWTLYACGIDPRNMSATYGALIHSEYPNAENPRPTTFPGMIWGTNYTRLVSQTVFTLFYAGRTYAPKCIIDGINIQDWLLSHFIGACVALAKGIAKVPGLYDECVIGWDSMNEPGEGFIGHPNLAVLNPELKLRKGPMPSPLEGLKLGMGEAVEVDDYYFGALGPTRGKKVKLDPKGKKLWLSSRADEERGSGKWGWKRDPGWDVEQCVWAQHGIWDPSTGTLLKPDYFATLPSSASPVDFEVDFWQEHFEKYATAIRAHHPEAILFIQPPVFHKPPKISKDVLKQRACSSPHFYDGLTLMTKHWNWFNADALGLIRGKYWTVLQAVKVGDAAIRQMMQDELSFFSKDTKECLGDYPTLIGEIGCPYDMDDKKAYGYVDGGKGEGDYSLQVRAWDASMNAMDGPNAHNFTLWTYVPDNSHEFGDLWNGEDLSLWSADDLEKPSEIESERKETKTPLESIQRDDSQAASLASTTTFVNPSTPTLSPSAISSGSFSSSLVLDGARAIEAICRPFPIALVGRPDKVEFDIRTSVFKLSVRVGPSDSTDGQVKSEIYLPFIHYAAQLQSQQVYGKSGSTSGSVSGSRVSLLQRARGNSTSSASSRASTPAPSPISPSAKSQFPIKEQEQKLVLDVDISVSTGTTSLSGQTLYWTYDVPSSERVITLQVKRKGGPIKRATTAGAQGAGGSWADTGLMSGAEVDGN